MVHVFHQTVGKAVWHALNEPVCQYLRTRNPRCSTVYIDSSLGPLARDSSCISASSYDMILTFFLIANTQTVCFYDRHPVVFTVVRCGAAQGEGNGARCWNTIPVPLAIATVLALIFVVNKLLIC